MAVRDVETLFETLAAKLCIHKGQTTVSRTRTTWMEDPEKGFYHHVTSIMLTLELKDPKASQCIASHGITAPRISVRAACFTQKKWYTPESNLRFAAWVSVPRFTDSKLSATIGHHRLVADRALLAFAFVKRR